MTIILYIELSPNISFFYGSHHTVQYTKIRFNMYNKFKITKTRFYFTCLIKYTHVYVLITHKTFYLNSLSVILQVFLCIVNKIQHFDKKINIYSSFFHCKVIWKSLCFRTNVFNIMVQRKILFYVFFISKKKKILV